MRRRLALLLFLLLAAEVSVAGKPASSNDIFSFASNLADRALASREPWMELVSLCDRIGPRFAGTPAYAAAAAWAAERLREDGLAVHTETVQIPLWIRGEERFDLLTPHARTLEAQGLGLSVGTPPEGIEAEVRVVGSFDELAERSSEVKGRIVLFDAPWKGYGQAVSFRSRGPEAAARAGAVGALVRSVTPASLSTPHTGMTHREEGVPTVPAAAVTTEDASAIRRLVEAGIPVRVRMQMGARLLGPVAASTVVGEVCGRERPHEVVLLGCHLDTWDVGPGAQDDGAGCVVVMEAAALVASLPVRPRRTLRVVLFAAEEIGLLGGQAYAEAHAGEAVVAALELDSGAGPVTGLGFDVRDPATGKPDPVELEAVRDRLAPFLPLLEPLGIREVTAGGSGPDVGFLVNAGAVGVGIDQDTAGYWPVHHSAADTPEKVDPAVLAHTTAVTTVVAWILAEMPGPIRTSRGSAPTSRS
ncbi:MAG: M20/M25/M40 family metallo-hydrolase [Deltaproteobacteria bacterium]|nr:M20/M25/M40 family metallo-hydrolase [Deltaproteobacteria bacterium]